MGQGELHIYHETYVASSYIVRLSLMTDIAPSDAHLHCIDVWDLEGLAWKMIPEGVDEDDSLNACKRWIDSFACYLPHPVSPITLKSI